MCKCPRRQTEVKNTRIPCQKKKKRIGLRSATPTKNSNRQTPHRVPAASLRALPDTAAIIIDDLLPQIITRRTDRFPKIRFRAGLRTENIGSKPVIANTGIIDGRRRSTPTAWTPTTITRAMPAAHRCHITHTTSHGRTLRLMDRPADTVGAWSLADTTHLPAEFLTPAAS